MGTVHVPTLQTLLKYWENELKLASNNALADAADIVAISKADPVETFWQAEFRVSKAGATASGNAVWKKVFDSVNPNEQVNSINAKLSNLRKARVMAKANDTCFVAGTLIHTKEGLRPIEQIKVGDWVLSQPEGKGELSYKRVTRTFVHESNDLWLVHFSHMVEKDGEKQYFTDDIVATGGHPFYTKEKGWVWAGDLAWESLRVEMASGHHAAIGYVAKIFQMETPNYVTETFQTETPNLGWSPREPGGDRMFGGGYLVEFGAEGLKVEHRFGPPETEWDVRFEPLVRTVYNFEVEDNHTYYVGTMGLWAHNKSVSVLVEEEAKLINGLQPEPAAIREKGLPGYQGIPELSNDGVAQKATPEVEPGRVGTLLVPTPFKPSS